MGSTAFNTDLSHSYPLHCHCPPPHPLRPYFDGEQVTFIWDLFESVSRFLNRHDFQEKSPSCPERQILTRSALCKVHAGDMGI